MYTCTFIILALESHRNLRHALINGRDQDKRSVLTFPLEMLAHRTPSLTSLLRQHKDKNTV